MVSTCVFVTIFLFGGSTHALLNMLGIGEGAKKNKENELEEEKIERANSRASFRRIGSRENLSMNDMTGGLGDVSDLSGSYTMGEDNDSEVSLLNHDGLLLSDDGLFDGSPAGKGVSSIRSHHFDYKTPKK